MQGPPNGQQGPPNGQQAAPNGQPMANAGTDPLGPNYKPLINVNPVLHINGFKHTAELAGGSISLPGDIKIPIPQGIQVCAQAPDRLALHSCVHG